MGVGNVINRLDNFILHRIIKEVNFDDEFESSNFSN